MMPENANTTMVIDTDRAKWLETLAYANMYDFNPIGQTDILDPNVGLGAHSEGEFIERRFLRYAPEFVDDPDGVNLFRNIGPAVYTSPRPLVAAANDVALVGYRTFITNGRFFNDDVISDAGKVDQVLKRLGENSAFLNEDTRLRPQMEARQFKLELNGQSWRHFDRTAVILCATEPSNYGSLLFRVIPKMYAVRKLGLTDLPVVCWNIRGATIPLLDMIGVRENQLIAHNTNTITTFPRAIVPSVRNPHAMLDHESRELFREIRTRYGSKPGRRRIYISRLTRGGRAGASRVMLNEADLISRLAALGFEIIEPETLSMVEQIETFSSAEMIVGPSGSGLFNVVFCHPGTKIIDIESEEQWIYAHTGLFASCSLRYGIFIGKIDPADPMPSHRRWNVNVDALVSRIQNFIRS